MIRIDGQFSVVQGHRRAMRLMKLLQVTIMLVLLFGCGRSDVPKNSFEKRMLNAVLLEAKKREFTVPNPYSFCIYEDTVYLEMKASINVWVVEISRKGNTNDPIIEARVDPTNFVVTAFSTFGAEPFSQRLIKKLSP